MFGQSTIGKWEVGLRLKGILVQFANVSVTFISYLNFSNIRSRCFYLLGYISLSGIQSVLMGKIKNGLWFKIFCMNVHSSIRNISVSDVLWSFTQIADTNKNAFQSKAHLPLAHRKSNTYNLTLTLVWPWPYIWPWPQTSETKLRGLAPLYCCKLVWHILWHQKNKINMPIFTKSMIHFCIDINILIKKNYIRQRSHIIMAF